MSQYPPADEASVHGGEGSSRSQHPDGSPHGSGESTSSRSPLNLGMGFLKGLTEKKSSREGQPPKRRGPKPDSKPALTRRQELNRQAQRTHRERKEQYIKNLEQEVLQLKERLAESNRQRAAAAEENLRLREILRQHGIQWPNPGFGYESTSPIGVGGVGADLGGSSSGSVSGSYRGTLSTGFSPPNPAMGYSTTTTTTTTPPLVAPSQRQMFGGGLAGQAPGQPQQRQQQQRQPAPGLDYDEAGIDFVLTLEQPCLDHIQALLMSSQEDEGDPFGHALMASCPPQSYVLEHPDEPYPHEEVQRRCKPELANLLNMGSRTNQDGEISPVSAWTMILSHPRLAELTRADFSLIRDELKGKIRCYGFGAVLEEFELRDALSSVFATKIESYAAFG
ncbi:MAG: hypothetical protein M1825_004969 [Sarcosagium campestre]|nr:MAG: hypothetical protein M1825_004969 [Sarcosagium campestre]